MDDEWTTNASEALNISLVRPASSGIEKVASFNPKFTYPIFGDDETIFGYKGLKINLQFDARNLRPHFSLSYIKKFDTVGEVEALDVRELMKDFMLGVAFQTSSEYKTALEAVQDNWTPPGTLVKTIEKNGETYEIWRGVLADAAILQLIRRIQVTVLFFIEGGSYIGVDENGNDDPKYSLARWSVFFVYKKERKPDNAEKYDYLIQGFSTVYDFWMYQQPLPSSAGDSTTPIQPKIDHSWEIPREVDLAQLPRRARISQFIILPPYQRKGIGAMLYDTIFELYMADVATKEITVEDPNEDFDVLRDVCDLKYMQKNLPEFAALKVNSTMAVPEKGGFLLNSTQITPDKSASSTAGGIINVKHLEEIRRKSKIAPRQFWRLVEMHLMSTLPLSVRPQTDSDSKRPHPSKSDQKVYMLWRILLKQRLYRRNVLVLSELETTERIIKLDETVGNVEWEYARILEHIGGSNSTGANAKRKLEVDMDVDKDNTEPLKKKVHL